jgi:lipocalin
MHSFCGWQRYEKKIKNGMKNGTKDGVLIHLFRFKIFMTIVLLLLTMLLVACVYNAGRDTIDRSTVKNFDLKSYMGRWYEIARFDHRFERGMTDVTATYTLQENGMVEVVNEGMRGENMHRAVGRAKTTNKSGCLRVSFFWKFYSDYNILAVAPDGGWMIIGSSSPKYLWILSRTPKLPAKTLEHIVELAAQRGYNVANLIYVKQP